MGEIEYEQDAASCEALNVRPAIVAVPLRAPPAFAATLSLTVPLPVPDPPADTDIQGVFEAAVHAHELPAETETISSPPDELTSELPGAIE